MGLLETETKWVQIQKAAPYQGLYYIVDFYCHALKLVIEVDGGIHRDREVRENDIDRQRHLEFEGMTFLRFTNEEIENNVEQVKMKIEKYCNDRKSHPLGLGLNQSDNK